MTLPGSVGPNAPLNVTATDSSGNVSTPTPTTTPADPVSPVLVAPTGNLTATTSAVGASNATATIPTTLKNSAGADVAVTSVITNSSGTAVTNGNLSAGTYTVTYTAAGYEDVTQTLVVSDPADTTAPDAPVVGSVTGNSTNGYTVTGTAEPNSTITIKNNNGDTVGTGTTDGSGNYTVTLPGSVGSNAPLNVTATDSSGNVSDPTSATTPADPVSPVLVAPTGNLTTTTSKKGAADATASLPATLKDSDGKTVPVTHVITNSTGTEVPNSKLSAGTYTVTYSAEGYANVTQTLVVSDPSSNTDTTAPNAPTVDSVTGDSGSGYTVNGKGEPGSTITVKNPATGEVLGTAVAGVDGSYTLKLPLGINPGTQVSVTATDASGNTSEPTLFTTPPTIMNGGMINGNMSTNIGGKHFSTADLPATGEANAGWLSMVGTVLLSLFGAMFFLTLSQFFRVTNVEF